MLIQPLESDREGMMDDKKSAYDVIIIMSLMSKNSH